MQNSQQSQSRPTAISSVAIADKWIHFGEVQPLVRKRWRSEDVLENDHPETTLVDGARNKETLEKCKHKHAIVTE